MEPRRFAPSTDRPERLDVGARLEDVRRFTLRHRSLVSACVAAGWTEDDLLQEVTTRVVAAQAPERKSRYDPQRGGVASYLVPMTRSILMNLRELRSATHRPDHVEYDDTHHHHEPDMPTPTRRRVATAEPEPELDTHDPETPAPSVQVIRRASAAAEADPRTVEVRLEGFSLQVGRLTVDVPPEVGLAGLELVARLVGR